jgi:hypothetical protein
MSFAASAYVGSKGVENFDEAIGDYFHILLCICGYFFVFSKTFYFWRYVATSETFL